MDDFSKMYDVVGYEGLYKISRGGTVISCERIDHGGGHRKEKILKPVIAASGYPVLRLTKNGKNKQHTLHRMLAEVFLPNPENKPQVNHIDGNKQNHELHNLEWCTSSENNLHAVRTGLKQRRFGEKARNIKWSIIATNIKTGKMYTINGLRDMTEMGFHNTCVYACIHGQRKQHKGFTFSKKLIKGE